MASLMASLMTTLQPESTAPASRLALDRVAEDEFGSHRKGRSGFDLKSESVDERYEEESRQVGARKLGNRGGEVCKFKLMVGRVEFSTRLHQIV